MMENTLTGFELSPQQKRCWNLRIGEAHPWASLSVQLLFRPEKEKWLQAVDQLLNRHEILQTVFHFYQGLDYPLQKIDQQLRPRVNFENIEEQEENIQAQRLAQFLKYKDRDYEQVTTAMSWSIEILYTSTDGDFLKICCPSLMTDSNSLQWILFELLNNYFEQPNSILDSSELLQYKDYASWQNELMQSPDEEVQTFLQKYSYKSQAYRTRLPFEKQAYPEANFSYQFIEQEISTDLLKAILELQKNTATTPDLFYFSLFQLLLHLHQPQQEGYIGFIPQQRQYDELEGAIGLIARPVPVYTPWSESIDLKSYLSKQQEAIADLLDWEDAFSFVKDNADINACLFSLLYEFKAPINQLAAFTDQIGRVNTAAHIEDFKLKLEVFQDQEYASIRLCYRADLFNAKAIERLAQQYISLLDSCSKHPDLPAEQLSLVGQEETTKLTKDFNPSVSTLIEKSCLDLFEAQVKLTPQLPALIDQQQIYSYRQLKEQSDAFAAYLIQVGKVKKGDVVGLTGERSVYLLIGLLGIWKAGAAYLPIAPGTPTKRMEHMLAESDCSIIATHQSQPLKTSLRVIDISAAVSDRSSTVELPTIDAHDLAYVIYTSGSTGQPKGCQISHGSLANYVQWSRKTYPIEGSINGFPLFTSIAFDLTVTSIFTPLINGHPVYIYPETLEITAILTHLFTANAHVGIVKLTPSHLEILAQLELDSTSIHTIILGGEAVTESHLEICRKLNPQLKVFNEYGPTEATVGCIAGILEDGQPILIGRPIDNTRIYILKDSLQLCGIGEFGEIHIGGSGLALGYHDPQQTAEKFIMHPIFQERLYKTGDYGRWTLEGTIEYVGRQDRQIKYKGHRIELREIESMLLNSGLVAEARVLLLERPDRTDYLCGFVRWSGETSNQASLQPFLEEHLPLHMIPSEIIPLTSFPLTVNGKVDQKALVQLREESIQKDKKIVLPVNEAEERMLSLWQEVLNMTDISTHDSLQSLGVDSIRIIRIVGAIKKQQGQKITVKEVYDHPSISALCKYLEKQANDSTHHLAILKATEQIQAFQKQYLNHPQLEELALGKIEQIYPLSSIEKGMVYSNLMGGEKGVYHDQVIYKFEEATFDLALFTQAMKLLLEKHETLRSCFLLEQFQDLLKLVYHPDTFDIQIEVKSLVDYSPAEQTRLMEQALEADRKQGFVINNQLLWRIQLYQFSSSVFGMLWTTHHAIMDGWSNASFITELGNTYQQLKTDAAFKPTALQATFHDFIVDQYAASSDASLRQFWKQSLDQYVRTDLPYQKIYHEGLLKQRNIRHAFAIQAPIANRLNDYCQQYEQSPKTIFLAAFLYLLKQLTQQNDLTIGLVNSIRPEVTDGDRLLGCFLNVPPFRFRFEDPAPQADTLINQVQLALNQFIDKGKLSLMDIMEITEDKSSVENPIFNIYFNYVDFHIFNDLDRSLKGQDTEVDIYDTANTFFDFTVSKTATAYYVSFVTLAQLYSEKELQQFTTYYNQIIDLLVSNQSLEALNLIGHEQKQWLSKQSVNPSTSYLNQLSLSKRSDGQDLDFTSLPNPELLILSTDTEELIPPGVVGEICIGGTQCDALFENQPGIAHPFREGETIYRTGGLGRWTLDGALEYHGKSQEVVWMQRRRINPYLVQQCLLSKAEITAAHLSVQNAPSGEEKLVAYIVASHPLNAPDLRTFLRKQLPDFLIPTAFIQLPAIPLTAEGQVDSTAIQPFENKMGTGTDYHAPENEIQQQLVKIWEEVLDIDPIGIDDNFFDLGGHSLKILKIVNKIEECYGSKLVVEEFYDNLTIRELAHEIDTILKINKVREQKEGRQNMNELKI